MKKQKPKKKKKLDETSFFSINNIKSDFKVVKTSLKSILKNYNVNFNIINNLVLETNEIIIRTYQFLRLYILHKYKQNEEIPTLNKDTILYFVRACGIRDNRGSKSKNETLLKELDDFYKNIYEPLINKPKYDLKNKSYLTPYIAIQIQTAFHNNLQEHYLTRIRRFMNIILENDETFIRIKNTDKCEFAKIKNLIVQDKIEEIPEHFKEFSMYIKNNYLPTEYEKCYGYDVKVNPEKYLFYTIKMNETIENLNKLIKENKTFTEEEKHCKIKKLFQPIPLKNSLIPPYITLDVNSILSLFKSKGESRLRQQTQKNKDFIWEKVFRTDKKVMKIKDYEFKTILTDGVGVSICFQKIEKSKTKKILDKDDIYIEDLNDNDLEICKTKKIVSIDPGKSNLVYMMDENKNKLRYTALQRRTESLTIRNNRIIRNEKYKNNIIQYETELSKFNCKSVNIEEFKNYIIEKNKLNTKTSDFYNQILFRKLKWRNFVYGRKSEDRFLNRINEVFNPEGKNGNKNNLLLSYGNWSNNKQMKYIVPTKGIGLRKSIQKKYNVVMVNEFKTSKLCSKCEKPLENYRGLHRVLVCRDYKCNGCESKRITFINRDMNACMNMINISKSFINSRNRPIHFCRDNNETNN